MTHQRCFLCNAISIVGDFPKGGGFKGVGTPPLGMLCTPCWKRRFPRLPAGRKSFKVNVDYGYIDHHLLHILNCMIEWLKYTNYLESSDKKEVKKGV